MCISKYPPDFGGMNKSIHFYLFEKELKIAKCTFPSVPSLCPTTPCLDIKMQPHTQVCYC